MKKNSFPIAFLILSALSCGDSLEGISQDTNNHPAQSSKIAPITPLPKDNYGEEIAALIGREGYLSGLLRVSLKMEFTKKDEQNPFIAVYLNNSFQTLIEIPESGVWTKGYGVELKDGDVLSFRENLKSNLIESNSFAVRATR